MVFGIRFPVKVESHILKLGRVLGHDDLYWMKVLNTERMKTMDYARQMQDTLAFACQYRLIFLATLH